MHRGEQELPLPALRHLSLCLCFTAVPRQGPSRVTVKLAAFVGLCLLLLVCLAKPAHLNFFTAYLLIVCQEVTDTEGLFVCVCLRKEQRGATNFTLQCNGLPQTPPPVHLHSSATVFCVNIQWPVDWLMLN